MRNSYSFWPGNLKEWPRNREEVNITKDLKEVG
jgi:hypothetical protein